VTRELGDFVNLHSHWIRHDFAWDAIEPQPGTFTWSGFDRWVGAARSHALNVIATVTYTPAWANGGSSNHDTQPTSAQQFGQFAGDVAARYASQGVHTYEIWNEPNIGFWRPVPNPATYTQVLCAAYQRIHAADPQATVLTGGTSPAGNGPASYSPQTWLADLYANGAKSCFDAVAHHPYVDSSATHGDLGNPWALMSNAYPPSNLRGILSANGDAAKRIWATEVGCNAAALGDSECSTRIAEAFKLWRGYPWAGVLCWFTYWDPNVYGLVNSGWTPRPEWHAYQAAAAEYG
jgi:polysaccharide biosynthesis protein PslG